MSTSLAIPAWVEVERDLFQPFAVVAADPERRAKAPGARGRCRTMSCFGDLVLKVFAWQAGLRCGGYARR